MSGVHDRCPDRRVAEWRLRGNGVFLFSVEYRYP